jgi:hypothetical protein
MKRSAEKLVMRYLFGRFLLPLARSPVSFDLAPPCFVFLFLCFRALRASTHDFPLFATNDDAFTSGLHSPSARIPHEVERLRLASANRAIRLELTGALVLRRGRLARGTFMRFLWGGSTGGGGTKWCDNRGRNCQVNGGRYLRVLVRGGTLDVSGLNAWRRRVHDDRGA